MCAAEDWNWERVEVINGRYHFTGKEPRRETVLDALNFKPKVLERKRIFERVVSKLMEMIGTFDDGVGDL